MGSFSAILFLSSSSSKAWPSVLRILTNLLHSTKPVLPWSNIANTFFMAARRDEEAGEEEMQVRWRKKINGSKILPTDGVRRRESKESSVEGRREGREREGYVKTGGRGANGKKKDASESFTDRWRAGKDKKGRKQRLMCC